MFTYKDMNKWELIALNINPFHVDIPTRELLKPGEKQWYWDDYIQLADNFWALVEVFDDYRTALDILVEKMDDVTPEIISSAEFKNALRETNPNI